MLCSLLCACAGSETPPLDGRLAEDVAAAYAGGQREAAAEAESAPTGPAPEAPAAAEEEPAQLGNPPQQAPEDSPDVDGSSVDGSSVDGDGAGEDTPPTEPEANEPSAEPVCDGFAILASSCGTSGCHGAGSNLGTFAASEAEALRYVGQPGTVCSSQGSLFDPDNPSESLMITKLSDFPPCGQPMPLAGPLLSDDEIECIEDWIGSL